MATAPPPDPNNPGLQAAQQAGAAQASQGPAYTSSTSPWDVIQQALFASAGYAPTTRGELTSTPLSGILPQWIRANPNLLQAVGQKLIDPYLPDPSDPSSYRVYVGRGSGVNHTKATGVTSANAAENAFMHRGDHVGDVTASAGSVANEPYQWSADQVAENIKKFREAGQTNVTDFNSLVSAWQGLVARAAQTYSFSSGKIKMTPWDALELDRQAQIKAGTLTASGSTVQSSTSRSVSDVRQADAWSALRQTASSLLGRDPSDQEVRDFAYRMNALAAQSPTITHSTQTTDINGNSTSSSHTKQGFDSADLERGAYDTAQSDPDYAEYQSATTYFNAALSALGSIGGN